MLQPPLASVISHFTVLLGEHCSLAVKKIVANTLNGSEGKALDKENFLGAKHFSSIAKAVMPHLGGGGGI
jgi:hypothetical protein